MGAFDLGSIWTNVFITACVVLFVILLPAIDLKLCKRFRISPDRVAGVTVRQRKRLRIRQVLLYVMFASYCAIFLYLVFFSRSAMEDYRVHVAPLQDLANAVYIDFGILGFLASIAREGLFKALEHVEIVNAYDIGQVYLNVMLFVPLGYLLPYVFRWPRVRVRIRPALLCFLISLLVENIQLITKLGFYDVDDIITNTVGGLLGQSLFIVFAYIVANPDWRQELDSAVRWRRSSRKRALYPFARGIDLSRTTILGSDKDVVWEFYGEKLGFHLVDQVVSTDPIGMCMLFKMGEMQMEVICSSQVRIPAEQRLAITAHNLPKIKKRLEKAGIVAGPIEDDLYKGMQRFTFSAPDNVVVTIIESYVDID